MKSWATSSHYVSNDFGQAYVWIMCRSLGVESRSSDKLDYSPRWEVLILSWVCLHTKWNKWSINALLKSNISLVNMGAPKMLNIDKSWLFCAGPPQVPNVTIWSTKFVFIHIGYNHLKLECVGMNEVGIWTCVSQLKDIYVMHGFLSFNNNLHMDNIIWIVCVISF